MDEIAVKVENVSKDFVLPQEKINSVKSLFTSLHRRRTTKNTQHALKDISFEIKKGEFFGIVGRNGSGKSTMLKMLAGIYQPTRGHIKVNGRLVPFIELGVGFNPELTGRENVYLNGAMMGFSKRETTAMYDEIVEFAELKPFMDQKLKNYSTGMQVRLAFSVAIKAEADVLVIDEVLAVGDEAFQRKCYDYFKSLKKAQKTVVFVTHDMSAVRDFCDRGILLEEGGVAFAGTSDKVSRKYSQLFMEEAPDNDGGSEVKKPQRFGNGDARIKDVKVNVGKENIVVSVKVVANKNLAELIYGLHILGADGKEITAMNNRMINTPDVKDLKAGSKIDFEWQMQNIFGDGKYTVMLTLVDGSMTPLDYIEEAATFRVKRTEKSNTAVIPPVSVSYSIS